MGAPKTEAWKRFFNKTPLDEHEVLTLVGDAVDIMRDGLKRTTLGILAEQVLPGLTSNPNISFERLLREVQVNGPVNLRSQGLFYPAKEDNWFWGITRDARWVVIQVCPGEKKDDLPILIDVHECSIGGVVSLCGADPIEIFARLRQLQGDIVSNKKVALREAEDIDDELLTLHRLYLAHKRVTQPAKTQAAVI